MACTLIEEIDSLTDDWAVADFHVPEDLDNPYGIVPLFDPRKYSSTDIALDSVTYEKYADVIKDFTDVGYKEAGVASRNGRYEGTDIAYFLAEAQENYVGTVSRGSRLTDEQIGILDEVMVEGGFLRNNAPLSTSRSVGIASGFAGDSYKEKGRKMAMFYISSKGHDITHLSKFDSEKEVILKPGKIFQVLKKVEGANQVHVMLEEIKPEVIEGLKDVPGFQNKFKEASGAILSAMGLSLGLETKEKTEEN